MGGEHFCCITWSWACPGSSPRGRGTLIPLECQDSIGRIIPAWAGNTFSIPQPSVTHTDHPRVGGEHESLPCERLPLIGSSPRGRGTHNLGGLGKHCRLIIPAWAGNTAVVALDLDCEPDHPRVGGEHDFARARSRSRVRIIPAWAGNTASIQSTAGFQTDHPRVGGEHSSCKPLI